MTLERFRRLLYGALVATVLGYALLVIHNFYTYVDYAIYVATDDSLANISYAWATIGRYGFLTSPHLGLVARTHGQFNYGPWYFGLGAALIWLFGYSLTILRSIHLWVIVFICGAAMRWFRDGHYSPAWVVAAMGSLSWFVTTQWPMVRPDSMVSLFAVLMVIAAGRAVERGSRTMWAAAGVAAACGAFTHLIAWSLVPVVGAAWLVSELLLLKRPIDRPQVRAAALRLASLAAGLAIGALMFYASFGFGFRTQLRFLRLYSDSTRAMLATGGQSLSAWHLFSRHFQAAFGHLNLFQQRTFMAALIAGWVLVVWSVRWREGSRRTFLAFCLPPLLAWTFYSLSLSTYANFHSGYKVLTQVMALWLVASLVFVGLRALWSTAPALASVVALAVTMACFYSSAITLRRSIKESDNRLLRTHEWVSVSQYINEMLAPIPDGATAWGTIMYGIENPGRIQLIQFGDAMQLTVALPAADRARLAPQYLVFGSQENAGSMSAVLGGTRNSLQIFSGLFPDARYQLIAMVSAPPYGVTRIYGRLLEPKSDAAPVVSVFDPLTHQWSRRVERIAAAVEPSEPVLLNFPWGGRVLHRRTDTTRALSLPAGDYVIRARLQPGSTSKGGGVIASDHFDLDPEVNDFGVSSDVASYKSSDTEAYLLWRHGGGLLHVGVIDEDRMTAITGIEAYRLDPMRALDTETVAFRPIAPWNAWDVLTTLGVRAATAADGLAVDGNDSRFGYQLMSPEIKMPAGARVRLRVQQQVERGRVCIGVLNKTQQHWLISPDQARPGYEFIADDSGAIRVVFANCGPADGPTNASRFVITAADYAVLERHLYADQLMDAYEAATRAQ